MPGLKNSSGTGASDCVLSVVGQVVFKQPTQHFRLWSVFEILLISVSLTLWTGSEAKCSHNEGKEKSHGHSSVLIPFTKDETDSSFHPQSSFEDGRI